MCDNELIVMAVMDLSAFITKALDRRPKEQAHSPTQAQLAQVVQVRSHVLGGPTSRLPAT